MFLCLFATSSFLAGSGVATGQIFVDQSAPGGDGSSWSQAINDLGAALAGASNGDQIWVAEGVYSGGFTVPNGVEMYGGFRSGDQSLIARRPHLQRSVLDGQSNDRVLNLGSCVVDGFVVRNGQADSVGGGGALVDGTNPTIRRCWFTGNRNVGGRGSTLFVTNGADPVVESSFFVGNVGNGHVIDVWNAKGTFRNIVVYDNLDNGLHMQNNADPVIENSIFANNTGAGLCAISSTDDPIFRNNLLFNNGFALFHVRGQNLNDIDDINALSFASGNMAAAPGFVDPAQEDYRLRADSPCIDTGVPGSSFDSFQDFYGNSRVLDGDVNDINTADVGAHEYSNVTLDYTGTPVAGSPITLVIDGTPGLTTYLSLGVGSDSGVFFPRFGYLFADLTKFWILFPVASAPTSFPMKIPGALGGGGTLFLQAVSFNAVTGNLSNPIEIAVP